MITHAPTKAVTLSSDTSHFTNLLQREPCLSQGLRYSAWEEELGDDIDSEFIINGIRNGVDIIAIMLLQNRFVWKTMPLLNMVASSMVKQASKFGRD